LQTSTKKPSFFHQNKNLSGPPTLTWGYPGWPLPRGDAPFLFCDVLGLACGVTRVSSVAGAPPPGTG